LVTIERPCTTLHRLGYVSLYDLSSTDPIRRKSYLVRNCGPWATFLSLIVWVYLAPLRRYDGLKVRTDTDKVRNSRSKSTQGHPRSLVLVPIESAYGIAY